MTRIYRDAWGIPHVRATTVLDLARGQGEVTARDRTWQLEYLRRRATGTTAEALGAPGVAWDRLARRTRIADLARRAHGRLQPETAAFLDAYVAGVNAGLDGAAASRELDELGLEPEPWQAWTPLAVFLAQHLLFASLPGKLWLDRAGRVLGDDARLLSAEGPSTSGSNAWAVGGARTASGQPLIGGDPHRTIESPGVYQQIRLACAEFDVVGFAFPGVPGVQHFAHAGDVAWAITNAMADYQDVFAERLRRGAGGVEALGADGWEPAASHLEQLAVRGEEPQVVEVITTARGTVFGGGPDDGHGLSLRTASAALEDLGFDSFLPLLRARSVEDVDAALDRWVEPVNNVVIADRTGAVRYRVAGRIPVRDDRHRRGIVDAREAGGAWTDWLVPLPRNEVPADGHAVTANERRGPESEPVGTSFAAPHRARRLHALLERRADLAPSDFAAFHGDTRLATAPAMQDLVRSVAPGPAGAAVRESILAWDGRMDAGSRGAAAFAAWRSALVRRIAAQPVLAPLAAPTDDDPVLAPWLDLTTRVAAGLESLVAARTPFGIDLAALAREALVDAATHPAAWGDSHVLAAVHAFDLHDRQSPPVPAPPLSGDSDCVRCTGSVPAVSDACTRGSVARYVWDLADRDAGGWVVPLGAAGDPAHRHHHDQVVPWAAGELVPLVTDWGRLEEEGGDAAEAMGLSVGSPVPARALDE